MILWIYLAGLIVATPVGFLFVDQNEDSAIAFLEAVDRSRLDLPFADVRVVSRKEVFDNSLLNVAATRSMKGAVYEYRILRDSKRVLVTVDQSRPEFQASTQHSNGWSFDGHFLRIDNWGQRPDVTASHATMGKMTRVPVDSTAETLRTKYGLSPLVDYRYLGIWNHRWGQHLNYDEYVLEHHLSSSLAGSVANAMQRGGACSIQTKANEPHLVSIVVESVADPTEVNQFAFYYIIEVDTSRQVIERYQSRYAPKVSMLQSPVLMYETKTQWAKKEFEGRQYIVPESIIFTESKNGQIADQDKMELSLEFVREDQLDAADFSWNAVKLQPGSYVEQEDGNVQQWDGNEFAGLPPEQQAAKISSASSLRFWWPVINVLLIVVSLCFWIAGKIRRRRESLKNSV